MMRLSRQILSFEKAIQKVLLVKSGPWVPLVLLVLPVPKARSVLRGQRAQSDLQGNREIPDLRARKD